MSENAQAMWRTLVEFVEQRRAESHIPGIAVGIWQGGEVTAQGFGVTNVDHPLPVTDTTLFQVGSITKTLTGTLIMRLVEAGKIGLDAPIRTYLPDFRVVNETASSEATVRDLMTHLSGWEGDLFLDTGQGDDALALYVAAMAKQAQLAPLRTHWSYNNAGFALLGHLIETVTGERYANVLQSQLLEPLGMSHAYLEPTDVMTHRYVVGHSGVGERASVVHPWHLQRAVGPMGGLISDLHSLLRYARYHLGDSSVASQPVITPASIAAMQMPQVTLWGEEEWGLTWGLERIGGAQVVYHTGGTTGQITRLMLLPGHNFAVAVFTNAQQGGPVAKAIADRALDLYLGVKRPEPQLQESSPETLASYVGSYANAFTDLELGLLAGRLVGQFRNKAGFPTQHVPPAPPPPPVTLGEVAPNRLMMLDGGFKNQLVDVVRTSAGEIGWLRSGGRLLRRQP
jgi:CubicO group peptidase (beta-lactamase class C family)